MSELKRILSEIVAEYDGKKYEITRECYYSKGDDGYRLGYFFWTEGNFGCDCNRSIILDFPEELDCGNTIKIRSITPSTPIIEGERVHSLILDEF